MKRLLFIGFLFGMVLLSACTSTKAPGPAVAEHGRSVEGPSPKLSAIDSLMWQQPDSALAVMLEFSASSEADSLSEFEGHYCQVQIAELLYKNNYAQSNRTEVLKRWIILIPLTMRFWRHERIILKVWATMSATASLRPAPNTSTPCESWKTISARMNWWARRRGLWR